MNYDLKDWWSLTTSINANRSVSKGEFEGVDYGNDTYSMDFRISTKFTIVERLNIQPTYYFRSPAKTAQGSYKSSMYLDIGASIDVFKKKGTLTLSVTDIFDTRRWRWTSEGEGFMIDGEFQWRTARGAKLSFNYQLDKRK